MKIRTLIIICMFFSLLPGNVFGDCTRYYHDLVPEGDYKGYMEFRYLDMDSLQNGVQDSVMVNPGGKVTPVVSLNWGENICNNCGIFINAFGDWEQKGELSKLYSGLPGKNSNIVTYFSFKAPSAPGEYDINVLISFKDGFSGDFLGESLCQSQCDDSQECHIFIARGKIEVKEVSSTDDIPPEIELAVENMERVFGDIEFFVGDNVAIDVIVNDKQAALKLIINGEETSDYFPYSWDTFNLTPGRYVIQAEAKDHKGSTAQDSVSVVLKNTTRDEIVSRWAGHVQGDIGSMAQSEDGRVAVAHGNSISIYNNKGKEWTFKAPGKVTRAALSPDGQVAAALSREIIFLFSGNGTPIWNHSAGQPISKMALSGKGDYVAYSANEVLFVIGEKGELEGNATFLNPITNLEISNDGGTILVSLSSEQGNLKTLSRSRDVLKSLTVPGDIDSIALGKQNDLFGVTAGNRFYLLENRTAQWQIDNPVNYTGLAISSNGKNILLYDNYNITILDGSGKLIHRAPLADASHISISPSGSHFAYSLGPYFHVVKNQRTDPLGFFEDNLNYILGGALAIAILILLIVMGRKIKSRKKEEKPAIEKEAVFSKPAPLEKATYPEQKRESNLELGVINSLNGLPLAGVKVESERGTLVTESRGRAIIKGFMGENLEIRISYPGFEDRLISMTLDREKIYEAIDLLPLVQEDIDLNRVMDNSIVALENSFLQMKGHDQCLPSYIKGIGEAVKESLGHGYKYLPPERGDEYRKVFFHHMTDLFNRAAMGLEEVMTDWKNVALYKAASRLPNRTCVPERINLEESFIKMGMDPGKFYSMEYSSTMNRLKNIDQLITSQIGRYTVNISMGIWKLARDLLYGIENMPPERAAVSLVIANLLLANIEKMLEDPHVQERLKLSIL